jgi:uridine kinase
VNRAADIVVKRIEKLKTERGGILVVALDGPSGVGKTTIARHIAERIDVVHVLCDDFFVGGRNQFWAGQSPQYQIDNVIDWRRIRREVIEPLKAGKQVGWHPFNWDTFEGLSPRVITAEPRRVLILDGAFFTRQELQDIVDLTVLVQTRKDVRVGRIIQREGAEYSEMWHATWQKAMDYYFEKMRPPESFDLIVDGE